MASKTTITAGPVTKATKAQEELAQEFVTLLMNVETQAKNLITRGPSAVSEAKADKPTDATTAIHKDLSKEMKKLTVTAKSTKKALDEIARALRNLKAGTIDVRGFQDAAAAPYATFGAVASQVHAMEKKKLWERCNRLINCEGMHIYAKDYAAAYALASVAWTKVK